MAYLDESNGHSADAVIGVWPAAGAPANGASVAAALRFITDAMSGAAGLASFPAAAAPANNVSLAEVVRALYAHLAPVSVEGLTAIDDSAQDERNLYRVLTIEPAVGAPLRDVDVIIDLDKAVNGFAAVETVVTIQIFVARKVDGTNWRAESPIEAALSGTLAAGRSQRAIIGSIGVGEAAAIMIRASADVTADMELPYVLNYCGLAAPTVTEVTL